MLKIISISILSVIAAFFLGMWVEGYIHPPITNTIQVSDNVDAKGVLIAFLGSLHDKNYAKAASVYGGDYSQLREWNPNIEPTNLVALWQNGCEQNGLNCLELRNASFASQPDPDTFIFNVWFSKADKITEFIGPTGVSMFSFTVIKTPEGKYLVTTMPVYTP